MQSELNALNAQNFQVNISNRNFAICSGKDSKDGNSNRRGKSTKENAAFKGSVEVHRDSPPGEKRECEGATRKVSGKIQISYDTREKTGT